MSPCYGASDAAIPQLATTRAECHPIVMPNRSSKARLKRKPPSDVNALARFLVDEATAKPSKMTPGKVVPKKNPAAVALGRLGGLKGGKARATRLTAEQRKEIAVLAAQARWKKSD